MIDIDHVCWWSLFSMPPAASRSRIVVTRPVGMTMLAALRRPDVLTSALQQTAAERETLAMQARNRILRPHLDV